MILGIHYFSAEVKTKIDVIPRGCFNWHNIVMNDDNDAKIIFKRLFSLKIGQVYTSVKFSARPHIWQCHQPDSVSEDPWEQF